MKTPVNTDMSEPLSARQIVDMLNLAPHPEGGWYRETWRASATTDATAGDAGNARATGSAIYFLLDVGEFSHWHKVDADELWLWHAGAPLSLSLSHNGRDAEAHILGPSLAAGQRPQRLVPAGSWQSATSLGAWTLVSCFVSPGFEFSGFELAAADWRPEP